jgi:hypothetical protein
MNKKSLIALAVVAGFGLSAALAQSITPPQVPSIGQTDLVQIITTGIPSAQSQYITAPAVAGVDLYSYQIPLTAFAITVPAHTALMYLNPAGTLATGAFTMEATPSDGQHLCFEDTQIQTAVTISAATGQTMLTSIGLGAVTAFAANTRYCYFYNRPLAGWIRTS